MCYDNQGASNSINGFSSSHRIDLFTNLRMETAHQRCCPGVGYFAGLNDALSLKTFCGCSGEQSRVRMTLPPGLLSYACRNDTNGRRITRLSNSQNG